MKTELAVQILSAPSILGLWPSGVETLADTLLEKDLVNRLQCESKPVTIRTLNHLYSSVRDEDSKCLNTVAIQKFSTQLAALTETVFNTQKFPLVLGGDCSILIGLMVAVKKCFNGGLIFIDAHADFYAPHQSTTGQVADMDLAVVTGRGPEALTNIDNLRPYVNDVMVLHLAQRDLEETKQYGSQLIQDSAITCLDLESIHRIGLDQTTRRIQKFLSQHAGEKFWLHFDTDALDDRLNPAVDYRLPGGLSFAEATTILYTLLHSGQVAGMSVTIFNPVKDITGDIAETILRILELGFSSGSSQHNSIG